MKPQSNRITNKLKDKSGESLTETLVALLISALAIAMLAGAIAASSGIVQRSRDKLAKYYSANEVIAEMPDEVPDAIKDTAAISTSGDLSFKNSNGNSESVGNMYFYSNEAFKDKVVTAYKIK